MEKELKIILKKIANFPNGATLEEICLFMGKNISRRTIQRRLSALVERELLLTEGKARARKYKIFTKKKETSKKFNNNLIPLSTAALEVQATVKKPIQAKKYVSYNLEFLDSYKPNSSFYLNKTIRDKLHKMGKSPEVKRPAGTYAKKIFHRLLIDLSFNSSRLEGNTYSLLETEQLIEQNILSDKRNIKESQMILNHKAAIEFLIESIDSIEINSFSIRNIHALLSKNLLGDIRACGKIRSIPIGIRSTVYIPLAVPQLIEECFIKILGKASLIKDPFEQAFFLMVHLPYLQPFENVNKRVSRLAANIPFIRENLCPLSFIDVPDQTYIHGLVGVYEQNKIELLRDVFIWAYERSCNIYATTKQTLIDPDIFRMQYNKEITETIQHIIYKKMSKEQTISYIEKQANKICPKQCQKFIEVLDRELLGLHEGNIACYQISLQDYTTWSFGWI